MLDRALQYYELRVGVTLKAIRLRQIQICWNIGCVRIDGLLKSLGGFAIPLEQNVCATSLSESGWVFRCDAFAVLELLQSLLVVLLRY